ncbi:S-methyl-5-thioadenosine phosphorylase [Sugiyamaella lignohabitans]|uniref:Purine nucleoside phosphorylase n=1 Tax=Sugiyamaella lignohabitans TaxID=796027 RepID=A0A167FNK4_9ASCO|nr:S-methyl-5-thioadenosine phosphorylase [Sugiyamaella lignohabitans]ANB15515.1 S-methyl-5-thioadenosine phosphorylase [Sugiyamaella lignohabitans]
MSSEQLATSFDEPVLLGVIGGTGLYSLSGLVPVAKLDITTPWGKPSSPVTISKTASGFPIAFISRHGVHHEFTPSTVPAQANIAALKHLGVNSIIAFSAVGSLQQHIKPRDFVIPTQIIDRTKGIRPSTFFDTGFVAHVPFGDPFDYKLGKLLGEFGHALGAEHEGDEVLLHTKKSEGGKDLTVICMEGPAFSTRAESKLYQSWGGSVINMSVLPEAKLAKEAEISYQMICMSTDYDAWREEEEPVTLEIVVGNLKANSANANNLLVAVLSTVEKAIKAGEIGKDLEGFMRHSVVTGRPAHDPVVKAKVQYLFPHYFDEERNL